MILMHFIAAVLAGFFDPLTLVAGILMGVAADNAKSAAVGGATAGGLLAALYASLSGIANPLVIAAAASSVIVVALLAYGVKIAIGKAPHKAQ